VRASPLGFYFCQMEMIGIDSKNPSVNTLVDSKGILVLYIPRH